MKLFEFKTIKIMEKFAELAPSLERYDAIIKYYKKEGNQAKVMEYQKKYWDLHKIEYEKQKVYNTPKINGE